MMKEQENYVKGRVMGPQLVLLSPCLRENVILTCKTLSFCVV